MTRTTKLAIALSIFSVAVRLIAIDQPYIDNWSWRQSDVAAIARNYLRNGFHFAYPQIDWGGDHPGYVGTEFPLLPFIAAIAYKTLGVHEWIGRLESIVFFALSLPFLFSLIRQVIGAEAAIWTVIFYSFAPLNVFTSREFMPDVPSLSLAIAGVYIFVRWLDQRKVTILLTSGLFVSLSILLKLPNIMIGAPIVWLAVAALSERRGPRSTSLDGQTPPLPSLAFFAAVTLLPSGMWYWHAYHIAQRFYPHHFFGAGGIRIMAASWYWGIVKQISSASLTPVLSILAIAGGFLSWRNPRAGFLYCWLGAMLIFLFVVGYGSRHQWYQLPLVPISAGFAGAACASITQRVTDLRVRVAVSILLLVTFSALSIYRVRPLYRSSAAALRDASLELQQLTPADALIAAADDGDPTLLYYAERKGWHFPEKNGIYNGNPGNDEQLLVDLAQLRERGATHLVFTTSTIWWLDAFPRFGLDVGASATLLKRTREFTIYQLAQRSR
jgi:4-amino-4-deoxy-L-arabinose transferase-like glycosyltransferase